MCRGAYLKRHKQCIKTVLSIFYYMPSLSRRQFFSKALRGAADALALASLILIYDPKPGSESWKPTPLPSASAVTSAVRQPSAAPSASAKSERKPEFEKLPVMKKEKDKLCEARKECGVIAARVYRTLTPDEYTTEYKNVKLFLWNIRDETALIMIDDKRGHIIQTPVEEGDCEKLRKDCFAIKIEKIEEGSITVSFSSTTY